MKLRMTKYYRYFLFNSDLYKCDLIWKVEACVMNSNSPALHCDWPCASNPAVCVCVCLGVGLIRPKGKIKFKNIDNEVFFLLFPHLQAPFPNSGFVNGFSSTGHYKTANNSLNMTRPYNRNRYVESWSCILSEVPWVVSSCLSVGEDALNPYMPVCG